MDKKEVMVPVDGTVVDWAKELQINRETGEAYDFHGKLVKEAAKPAHRQPAGKADVPEPALPEAPMDAHGEVKPGDETKPPSDPHQHTFREPNPKPDPNVPPRKK